jgi:hypothetical protein
LCLCADQAQTDILNRMEGFAIFVLFLLIYLVVLPRIPGLARFT